MPRKRHFSLQLTAHDDADPVGAEKGSYITLNGLDIAGPRAVRRTVARAAELLHDILRKYGEGVLTYTMGDGSTDEHGVPMPWTEADLE